jgi:hypothetical protein
MPQRISGDTAREILRRAAELEASGASDVSLAELRLAAARAGISQEALECALRERATEDAAPIGRDETAIETYTRWLQRLLPGWTRSALVGATGFAWGLLTRLVEQIASEEPMIAMFAAIAPAVLVLVMHHRHRGSMLGFQEDLLAFFLGYLGAVLLVPVTIWSIRNALLLTASAWSTSVLIGGGLMLVPDRAAAEETLDGG